MNQEIKLNEQLDDCITDAALYALGTLSPDKAKAVELRLQSGCPFCSATVEQYAEVAEQLSLSVAPVEPPVELRDTLLARINAPKAHENGNRTVVRSADSPWKRTPIDGVQMRSLIGEKTFLIRMQPGAVFPKHDHPQAEQCYVLSGSITDSDGLTLHAGDFVVMSRDIQHDPIHTAAGCTLLIAYAD
jgi:anti-sigma factor ChrR (cupin superfamily)